VQSFLLGNVIQHSISTVHNYGIFLRSRVKFFQATAIVVDQYSPIPNFFESYLLPLAIVPKCIGFMNRPSFSTRCVVDEFIARVGVGVEGKV
jgi:hypothetical protein